MTQLCHEGGDSRVTRAGRGAANAGVSALAG